MNPVMNTDWNRYRESLEQAVAHFRKQACPPPPAVPHTNASAASKQKLNLTLCIGCAPIKGNVVFATIEDLTSTFRAEIGSRAASGQWQGLPYNQGKSLLAAEIRKLMESLEGDACISLDPGTDLGRVALEVLSDFATVIIQGHR